MAKPIRVRTFATSVLLLVLMAHFWLLLKLGALDSLLHHNADHSAGQVQLEDVDEVAAAADKIHLLFTSSASYTIGLLALVNSTLLSNPPATVERLKFHVISSNEAEVTEVLKLLYARFGDQLVGKVTGYGLEEVADPSLFEGLKVWAGYRAESLSKPIVFARYLVPDILPKSIKRVIYIDQDMVVLDDLAPLWDVDLEGYPLAGARLCRPSALWRKQFVMNKPYLVEGHYDHDTCTLNNGLLVYDLDKWRTKEQPTYTDELFEWTRRNSLDKLYSLGSQPPFNLVFYRNYKILDDRWNLMDVAGLREDTEYGSGMPWTRSRDEVDSAAVLHWNGLIKPWSCNGEGYYAEMWTKYLPDFRELLPADFELDPACSTLVVTDPPAPPSVEQFTVVIVSYKRIDTIMKIARHLQHSDYIKEIIVAWNNQETPCPAELVEFPWVRCIQQDANLVHNRFLIWPHVQTEAVLHYDDDLLAPLEDLEAAFQVWRHHREQVVGFEPRVIVCDEPVQAELRIVEEPVVQTSPADPFLADPLEPTAEAVSTTQALPTLLPMVVTKRSNSLPTGCKYKFKLHDGHFDLIIGKLFMVSKFYMKAYFENPGLVDLSTNAPCEDLAMPFLVASSPQLSAINAQALSGVAHNTAPDYSPRAAILFKSNLTEIHSKLYAGLSQGIDSGVWRDLRHDCVQRLVGIFGHLPGKQSSYYERDAVRRRVYKLPVRGRLDEGWCSDVFGSRVCRQP